MFQLSWQSPRKSHIFYQTFFNLKPQLYHKLAINLIKKTDFLLDWSKFLLDWSNFYWICLSPTSCTYFAVCCVDCDWWWDLGCRVWCSGLGCCLTTLEPVTASSAGYCRQYHTRANLQTNRLLTCLILYLLWLNHSQTAAPGSCTVTALPGGLFTI